MTTSNTIASFSLAVLPVLFTACQQTESPTESPKNPAIVLDSDRGAMLFETHCAVCHGVEGRADGPASPFLFPPARSFESGQFRLVSTANQVPREEDLVATMKRGMPGSSMPSWDWLGDADLRNLAIHVRKLAVLGSADRILEQSRDGEHPLTLAEAHRRATEEFEPGAVIDVPTAASTVDKNLGQSLYGQNCAPCHGLHGQGQREPRVNQDGGLNWARDLTAGLIKGGTTKRELAWRISAGMPGSAMPATEFSELELSSLVAHVQEMIPDQTDKRLVQVAKRLRVRRVNTPLPLAPDDQGWQASEEVNLVLAPLWWRDESVVYATIGAVHDGESIAIRLRWPDVTGKTTTLSDATRVDAAALQLSRASAPPLFGMGSASEPTSIWHWKSINVTDVAGALDLDPTDPDLSTTTRVGEVGRSQPVYHLLGARPVVSENVESMTVRGIDSVEDAERNESEVHIRPEWHDGEWSIVLSRQLLPKGSDEIAIDLGESVLVACAIWNGAAGDRGPQKSISIWHELVLDD